MTKPKTKPPAPAPAPTLADANHMADEILDLLCAMRFAYREFLLLLTAMRAECAKPPRRTLYERIVKWWFCPKEPRDG